MPFNLSLKHAFSLIPFFTLEYTLQFGFHSYCDLTVACSTVKRSEIVHTLLAVFAWKRKMQRLDEAIRGISFAYYCSLHMSV